MARAIDGDKLVENLRLIATCWSVSPYVSKEKHNGAINMLREVEREVKKAPLLTPPNEWISVDDRLPEDDVPEHKVQIFVLVLTDRGVVKIKNRTYHPEKFYYGKFYPEKWDWGTFNDDHITHWMPLPAPPNCRPPEGEENT